MIEKMIASVLTLCGISAFAKDAEGKSVLTADQKKMLTDKFGDKFVEAFAKEIQAFENTGKKADGKEVQEAVAKNATEQGKNAKELQEARDKISALEQSNREKDQKIASLEKDECPDGGQQLAGGKKGDMNKKFKADMNLAHNQYIAAATKGASYGGNSTIETGELQTEFGRYVSSDKYEIFTSLVGTTESLEYMTTMITDKFEVRASQAHITSVLQSFVPAWTPKGKTTFTPLTIKQYPMKLNVSIIPSDIIDQVLGYYYDENLTPEDMPIVKYIINVLVKPILDEERETAFAVGEYKEPTKGEDGKYQANEANQVCEGYVTQLKKIKAGGNKENVTFLLEGIALGTGNTLLNNVDKAVDEVSSKYKKKKLPVHADPDLITLYSRAYRDKYPNTKNQDGDKVTIDFTNFTFVPLEGMRGTGSFFITPKENFRHIMSRDPKTMNLRMATVDYEAKVYGEWREGVGFWIGEAIFAYLPPAAPEQSQGL